MPEFVQAIENRWTGLRSFANTRVQQVVARETELPLTDGPIVLVQILPLDCFSSSPSRILELPLSPENQGLVWPFGERGHNQEFIAEGIVANAPAREGKYSSAYSLVRFDGSCESASILDRHNKNRIGAYSIGNNTIKRVRAFCKLFRNLNLQAPVAVQLTLAGVKGIEFDSSGSAMCDGRVLQMDTLSAPIINLGTPEEFENPDSALRPMMDFLWRAGGVNRCFGYKNDHWKDL